MSDTRKPDKRRAINRARKLKRLAAWSRDPLPSGRFLYCMRRARA